MHSNSEHEDMRQVLEPIGYVESDFARSTAPEVLRGRTARIHILPQYAEGLYGIEECEQLNVLFLFHRAKGYTLKGPRRNGRVRGVFASRSPHRPNRIGLSRVQLLERKHLTLTVKNLDALDGTPVLDIKPYYPRADEVIATETP